MKRQYIYIVITLLLALTLGVIYQAQAVDEDYVWSANNGLVQFEKDGKLGLMSVAGEVILEPTYDYIDPRIVEDVIIVKKDGKFGYMKTDGSEISAPQWDDADRFCNGLAVVRDSNTEDEVTYIKMDGTTLSDPSWTRVWNFGAYAAVDTKEGDYFIDANGKIVLDLRPYCTDSHKISSVFVEIFDPRGLPEFGDKFGLMDIKGNVTIKPTRIDEDFDYAEGAAIFWKKGKWGIMDPYGKVLVKPIAVGAYPPQDGRILMEIKEGQWRCYNTEGKLLFKIFNGFMYPFSDEMAFVFGDMYGKDSYFIDVDGIRLSLPQEVINCDDSFYEGLLGVLTENGRGYMNKMGEIVIMVGDESRVAEVYGFEEGVAKIILTDGQEGYINTKGEIVSGIKTK